jgi:nicotinamide-nucleotide amidase
MDVEIINTGTELLLGDIVNTSFQILARTLNDAGYNVLYQTTIGDNPERLLEALKIALSRADIVITTGGLGPTRGDITTEIVGKLVGKPLVLNTWWYEKLKKDFALRGRELTENHRKMCLIPEGGKALYNSAGTAPGIAVETPEHKLIVMLPGPPAETKAVFMEEVMPLLRKRYASQGVIHSRVLHLIGVTESYVAEQLDDVVQAQTNPTVAIYARNGEIIIRLTAKSDTLEHAEAMLAEEEKLIRAHVGDAIYGVDYESLAETLGKALKAKNLTIAFAESCTGGLASSLMTDIPGSSEYLPGSIVSYCNRVKHEQLGVPEDTLEKYTAVSEQTCKAMAEGVRERIKADVGVSVTGIAGPGGGTPEKPVGLVYIGCATRLGTVVRELRFRASRTTIKKRSAMRAMGLALEQVKKL